MQVPKTDFTFKNGLLTLVLLLCCSPGCLFAQQAKLRKASQYMEVLQYEKAIDIYQKLVDKEDNADALRQLGIAYRKLNRYDEAAVIFARLTQLPEAETNDFWNQGIALMHSGRCEAAQIVFRQFLLRKPYDERRAYLDDACHWYQELTEGQKERFQVDRPAFNGPGSDISPVYYNQQLIFGSVRSDDPKAPPFYDLYVVDLPDGQPLPFTHAQVIEGNEAIVTFDRHLTELYLTRNRQLKETDSGLRRLEIANALRGADGEWGQLLPLPFNSDDYSVAHPALSEDGQRLFFSSDMPGGFGGKDLYICHRLGAEWGPPINLGPIINTEGDELYPYYHESGELYFSSDGHFGIGGQDIFRSEDLGLGNWSRPANLGAPLNSAADDFGLILAPDERSGYFTSNRAQQDTGDDIYHFVPRRVRLELSFSTVEEGRRFPLRFYHNDKPVSTDITGRYTTYLDWNECGRFRVIQADIEPISYDYCARDQQADTLIVDIPLQSTNLSPVSPGQQMIVTGQLLDPLTQAPIMQARAELLSIGDDTALLEVGSDTEGRYRLTIGTTGCYQLRFTHPGYFSQTLAYSICTQTEGGTLPIEPVYLQPYRSETAPPANDNWVARSGEMLFSTQNSRRDTAGNLAFQLEVFYDVGRASVRPEAISELQKLLRLLQENADVIVEISSHTDTRGDADLNQRLSQRRAMAIVQYLVKRGISADRVSGKGYGESEPVNRCIDGVSCTEAEHQENRRTEFKVIGQVEN